MLQVQGRSDLYLGLEIVKKIIYLGPLFVGAFIGIMPMLFTNIGMTIVAFFLNSYYSGKLIGYSSWMQIKDIVPSYGIASIVALSVYFLKFLPISYWLVLPLQLFLCCVTFFIVCVITNVEEYRETKEIFLHYFSKMS
jgi:hypothetical protein